MASEKHHSNHASGLAFLLALALQHAGAVRAQRVRRHDPAVRVRQEDHVLAAVRKCGDERREVRSVIVQRGGRFGCVAAGRGEIRHVGLRRGRERR